MKSSSRYRQHVHAFSIAVLAAARTPRWCPHFPTDTPRIYHHTPTTQCTVSLNRHDTGAKNRNDNSPPPDYANLAKLLGRRRGTVIEIITIPTMRFRIQRQPRWWMVGSGANAEKTLGKKRCIYVHVLLHNPKLLQSSVIKSAAVV